MLSEPTIVSRSGLCIFCAFLLLEKRGYPHPIHLLQVSYGVDVPAIVRKDNIIGMQFHPEKSGAVGVKILK
jgi:hypothetical protein